MRKPWLRLKIPQLQGIMYFLVIKKGSRISQLIMCDFVKIEIFLYVEKLKLIYEI